MKEAFWKTFQNSQQTQQAVIRRCSVKRKDALKNFAKFTEKHLTRSLFLNRVAGWKLETVRSSRWRCSVKQGVYKNFANFIGKNLCWNLFLIKWQFWGPATLLKKTPTQVLSCEMSVKRLWTSTGKLF